MYPRGLIYKFGKSSLHGEIYLHASFGVRILYGMARGIGAGIIGFVIIAFLFTFGPLIKQEVFYDLGINRSVIDETNLVNAQNTSLVQQEAQSFGVSSYFSVVIPKIDAKANIIANVDPTNAKEYDTVLMEGVAHAKGTYFPGQGKLVYLFAHSTNSPLNVARYNAVFYLLDKLQAGDDVVIYFADKRYVYSVTQTRIVGPNDTSAMNVSAYNSEMLVLQTCYPPGTSWDRLLVFAKPK